MHQIADSFTSYYWGNSVFFLDVKNEIILDSYETVIINQNLSHILVSNDFVLYVAQRDQMDIYTDIVPRAQTQECYFCTVV